MLACVMSAKFAKGVSKKTNKPFEAIVAHVVFPGISESDPHECQVVWISPELLKGEVPEYGAVLDLQYNRDGYLFAANVLPGQKCELMIFDEVN